MHTDPLASRDVSRPLSLRDLRELYMQHAERHYRRRNGEPTREHLNMRAAIDHYIAYAGETADLAKLNRHQVRAWLDQLVAQDLSRPYINACLSRLRRFVRWCADLDHTPMSVIEQLRLVRPLQPHRTTAREPKEHTPPPADTLDRVIKSMPSPARDVCQLLRLTAARPSELLELVNAEVHLDQQPRLTPLQHKTAHHAHQRVIPLSPSAVAIVERFHRPLCPLDSLFPSSRSRSGHLTITAVRAALIRACRRAGMKPCKLYDLRRRSAREVRRTAGLDAAQALLGHANASTTEIYAPLDAGNLEAFHAAQRAAEVLDAR